MVLLREDFLGIGKVFIGNKRDILFFICAPSELIPDEILMYKIKISC